MRSDWPEPKPHGSYVCTVGCSQIERQSSSLSTGNAVRLGIDLYVKMHSKCQKCLTYTTRDLKCASKSNPWYNCDCFTWEKFRGETMNSRLHFKISTSSFQTKLFCLCTRALRGNRLHRPFHARGDRGYFSPFSPRPPTPPTVRPRFTQLVHPISFASSPLP